jgi:hypothetical protein
MERLETLAAQYRELLLMRADRREDPDPAGSYDELFSLVYDRVQSLLGQVRLDLRREMERFTPNGVMWISGRLWVQVAEREHANPAGNDPDGFVILEPGEIAGEWPEPAAGDTQRSSLFAIASQVERDREATRKVSQTAFLEVASRLSRISSLAPAANGHA